MIEFDTLNLPAFEAPHHPWQAITLGLAFSLLNSALIIFVMAWHQSQPIATNRRGSLGKFQA
jgi:hypothetical protein